MTTMIPMVLIVSLVYIVITNLTANAPLMANPITRELLWLSFAVIQGVSFMNIYIHKDGGGLKPASYHNIDLTISPSTGPSIHYIQVGQSLQLSNGIDKIDYWYDTVDLFNIDFNKDTKVSYKQYISGTVTCTKKIGTETTLTFNNVVLKNSDNETKVTINGTFVCDEF